jgi:hypothetical protein
MTKRLFDIRNRNQRRLVSRTRGRIHANTTSYFSDVLIKVNSFRRLVPMPFTTVMIASEIPAAISRIRSQWLRSRRQEIGNEFHDTIPRQN